MSVKHYDSTFFLPDWRNLGTTLRIVLGVNAAMVLAVMIRHSQPAEWAMAITELAGTVEPFLILELTLLWLLAPLLARLTYPLNVLAVTAITVLSAVLITLLLDGTLWPHVVPKVLWSLLLQMVLLYYFHMRNRMLSPVVTEAKLQALQARIRPHFLFNSINAVMSIVRHDPRQAEAALQDMADLFRVLMRDNRELTPLADEVELCRQYLGLEKLRLGSRLEVDWNIKSMPADALVPPLVLQPLLENAIHHGIESSSSGGVISVNIFESRNEVHALLRNPYRPGNEHHHRGNRIAVANVRARLALHFDAEANLAAKVVNDAFYEVHIRMPYRKQPVRKEGNGKHALPDNKGNDKKGERQEGAPQKSDRARDVTRAPSRATVARPAQGKRS